MLSLTGKSEHDWSCRPIRGSFLGFPVCIEAPDSAPEICIAGDWISFDFDRDGVLRVADFGLFTIDHIEALQRKGIEIMSVA